MKLDCKVIEDLLPLYLDNMCSEQSRKMVEEHLAECEECRRLVKSTQTVQIPHIEPEKPAADSAVKKSFKKIRFRWWISVLAVLILVPVIFLGWNQYHGRGVHYTNIYEMQIGNAFMKCLDEGDYEKAYQYIDIDGLKQEWLEQWFDEKNLKISSQTALQNSVNTERK
ncbi:MAG: zf-HC2 domain-containing protein [Tyzzerella sp.]|nr:zf-HC2 domain-containing protein [Tyzzerella sp.]